MLIDQATAGSLENLNNSHVSKFLKNRHSKATGAPVRVCVKAFKQFV